MPDNSVDSIVTDPPYELGFMGKSWDSSGIAFNVDVWTEALRVLKPGGHLIAFSGSRTYHRMAVAIEDAGFEIRDQIMWIYGSGFPKSHNISKGIDKAAGVERKEIIGWTNKGMPSGANKAIHHGEGSEPTPVTAPATAEAKQWQGWGTALKPAHEPMVLARKPIVGTVANNVLTYGVGGLNIDGARVESGETLARPFNEAKNDVFGKYEQFGNPIEPSGRFPANFIHDGSDEVLALFPDTKSSKLNKASITAQNAIYGNRPKEMTGIFDYGDSGSAARFFYCAKASKRDRNEGLDGFEPQKMDESRNEGNPGGDNPRNRGLTQRANHHPTVKPTDLMRYLCKLVTPPNGTVLDPFMGSGSTGKAAILEGFDFIGIDMTPEYVEIAEARINWAKEQDKDYLL